MCNMSKTLELMLEKGIVREISTDSTQSFVGDFSFPEMGNVFKMSVQDDEFNGLMDQGLDIHYLTRDIKSTDISIVCVKTDGRTMYVPQKHAITSDITDYYLLCAYLWYCTKHYGGNGAYCDKVWYHIGFEHEYILPWEKQNAQDEKKRMRVEQKAYKCVVESGYGHAFRDKIYALIKEAYLNSVKGLVDKYSQLNYLPRLRSKTKKLLSEEYCEILRGVFPCSELRFKYEYSMLTAIIHIGNTVLQTKVLAFSNKNWDREFSVDVFDFLAVTPNISGDLKIAFYDHEENGKFVLEFGDMEFSTLSK